MKKKLYAFLAIVSLMVVTPSNAFADSDSEGKIHGSYKIVEVKERETVVPADSVTINGRTYGKDDGLEQHTVTYNLVKVPSSKYEARDWVPYHNYKWTRGSSYVQNQEIGYLHYRGTVLATGTIDPASGKRVINASITYKRGNTVLKKAQSNATFKTNRWISGGTKTVTVTDSINPKAPQTKVFYNFYMVNRNLVG